MRGLEDRDDQFKTMLNEKLQITDNSSIIQIYNEETGESLDI